VLFAKIRLTPSVQNGWGFFFCQNARKRKTTCKNYLQNIKIYGIIVDMLAEKLRGINFCSIFLANFFQGDVIMSAATVCILITIMLYLAMMDITKKWTGKRREWGQIHSQLEIFFADRLS
jgi:hypothetical protein